MAVATEDLEYVPVPKSSPSSHAPPVGGTCSSRYSSHLSYSLQSLSSVVDRELDSSTDNMIKHTSLDNILSH